MNQHIERVIEELNLYYNSPLPKNKEEWVEELKHLLLIPDIETLAIKRGRASLDTPTIDLMRLFGDIIHKENEE